MKDTVTLSAGQGKDLLSSLTLEARDLVVKKLLPNSKGYEEVDGSFRELEYSTQGFIELFVMGDDSLSPWLLRALVDQLTHDINVLDLKPEGLDDSLKLSLGNLETIGSIFEKISGYLVTLKNSAMSKLGFASRKAWDEHSFEHGFSTLEEAWSDEVQSLYWYYSLCDMAGMIADSGEIGESREDDVSQENLVIKSDIVTMFERLRGNLGCE